MTTAVWAPPPVWSAPRDWVGETCFVICGGESVKGYRTLVPLLAGRVIAVKEAVYLRPDADVLFFAGEKPEVIAPPLLKRFRGLAAVVRGKGHPVFPDTVKRIGRTETHEAWSSDPTRVAGYDAGTSAINLAILRGATTIALIGYDMGGGRWFTGEHPHPMPHIPEARHRQHMQPLPSLAADAKAKGIRIVNCSPISRATWFEYQPLEAFL